MMLGQVVTTYTFVKVLARMADDRPRTARLTVALRTYCRANP
jgi:hypothetical protein